MLLFENFKRRQFLNWGAIMAPPPRQVGLKGASRLWFGETTAWRRGQLKENFNVLRSSGICEPTIYNSKGICAFFVIVFRPVVNQKIEFQLTGKGEIGFRATLRHQQGKGILSLYFCLYFLLDAPLERGSVHSHNHFNAIIHTRVHLGNHTIRNH